jgi:hypothetical protein
MTHYFPSSASLTPSSNLFSSNGNSLTGTNSSSATLAPNETPFRNSTYTPSTTSLPIYLDNLGFLPSLPLPGIASPRSGRHTHHGGDAASNLASRTQQALEETSTLYDRHHETLARDDHVFHRTFALYEILKRNTYTHTSWPNTCRPVILRSIRDAKRLNLRKVARTLCSFFSPESEHSETPRTASPLPTPTMTSLPQEARRVSRLCFT